MIGEIMSRLIKNLTNAAIVGCARRGEDGTTTTGNMSTRGATASGYAGRMPKAWARLFGDRHYRGLVSQVIYSYGTPIAWLDAEYGWIVPQVTYSTTTSSKHQTHLYKLAGRHIYLPYDATPEDAQRVLDKKMYFTKDRSYAGPEFVEGE